MIEINKDFKKGLEILQSTDKSLFLTGKAGTGKSTFLRYIKSKVKKKKVILAPTGLAAINVEGQTIHSFFHIPPNFTNSDIEKAGKRLQRLKMTKVLEMVVIDEISMVRVDLLDAVDYVLRIAKKNNLPFGGLQMVFIGDLYQLPPIIKYQEQQALMSIYESEYFFHSRAFLELITTFKDRFEYLELKKIYRQNDKEFIDILNKVRFNELDSKALHFINQKYNPDWQEFDESHIIVTTKNDFVLNYNMSKLRQLEGISKTFTGVFTGDFNRYSLPTEEKIHLKVGARVIFVKNDANRRWVNGSLGAVVALSNNEVTVKIDDGQEEVVTYDIWEITRAKYDEEKGEITQEVLGTFSQLPLKLSWAITIHKSQGQTFKKMILDLGSGAFATGQTYVALSRCQTIDGLVLAAPIKFSDLKTDSRVTRFLKALESKNNSYEI